MQIAQETIYWQDEAAGFKLVRLAMAYRTAAIRDPKAFIRMIGAFPKSSGGLAAVKFKEKYLEWMREGRDTLLRAQVYAQLIDGYVPAREAPSDQFVYTVTAYSGDEKRGNPFGANNTVSMDEALRSGIIVPGAGGKESAAGMQRVIDPFQDPEDGGNEPYAVELEVKLYESSGKRLSLPGEFTAKFKLQDGTLKAIGGEWQILQERLKDRFLGGLVTDIEFSFSLEGNVKPDDSLKRTLKSFSTEAKAALSAKVRIPYLGHKIKVTLGVKGDHEGKVGPVLEISF